MATKTIPKRGREAEAPKPRGRQAREARGEEGGTSTFFHRLGVLASDVRGLVPSIKGKSWAPVAFAVDTAGLLANEREQYAVGAGYREMINNVFDAGGTQCDIVVDVENNQVIITGNGKPIQNVEELSTLFSVAKRRNKVVEDVDGNVRVIIGEKGRGRLAASVDCDEAYWTSEFGEFKVEFLEGKDLKIAARKTPSRKVEKGKTVVVMKRDKKNPYDIEWIRKFLCETYAYFGGQNFRISLNGEEIPMKEFKPTSRMLVSPLGNDEIKGKIATVREFTIGATNFYVIDPRVSDAELYTFAGENPRVQVVSVQYDHAEKNGRTYLSQRVPVTSESYTSLGEFVVDSLFTLRPDRHSFAEWRVGNEVLDSHVSYTLMRTADCAFGLFLESEAFAESGWNTINGQHYARVLQFLESGTYSSQLKVPSLEIVAFVPQEDGSAKSVLTTLGHVHSAKREVVVIDPTQFDRADMATLDAIPSAVHKGKIIIFTEHQNAIANLLTSLGVKKVHSGYGREVDRVMGGIAGATKFAVRKTEKNEIPLVGKLGEALRLLGVDAKAGVAEYIGNKGNTDSVAYVNGKICIVRGSEAYNGLVSLESPDVARLMLTTADSLTKAIAEKAYDEQLDGEKRTRDQLQLDVYSRLVSVIAQLLGYRDE